MAKRTPLVLGVEEFDEQRDKAGEVRQEGGAEEKAGLSREPERMRMECREFEG